MLYGPSSAASQAVEEWKGRWAVSEQMTGPTLGRIRQRVPSVACCPVLRAPPQKGVAQYRFRRIAVLRGS
ncbi:hypothetical protein GCM10010442_64910 [Kitasatospora kifunensis]